ncbi:pyruvate dehydrogenase complex dihydrolipoamide acetyltransferase [Aquimarina brevivitae]|uniref:Acetyltransferase component of pyruvate dehydrogenase complex n=1 Tax=Aquimarina brevivitae TaxID=323412 RepID=A0A4Q7PH75_9FLAO|nr:pyruvate dehydrogenase complex dihydrolipoamide acetyltransferase [Aquimarina brevivitae]RZS99896.1 pyruvate dehydrogenase E2 component (dihydrolipoamide acetyltransferase) [Aquimarina brevivitae]
MAEVIKMPRLSDTMEEGTVAKWLVQKGDKISEGDILAEIETDKATMEFESFYEGTLLHIGVEEGDTAPVDQLLAIIGEEGEDISALIDGSSDSKESNDDDSKEETDAKAEESSVTSEGNDDIPEGVEVITMPRLSDTMEEGTVASWLKSVGDKVEEGDILAEIETDKATMEFESFYSGTLLHIGIEEGQTAPVDALLAIIGPEGTDVSGIKDGKSSGDKTKAKDSSDSKEEKSTSKEKTTNKEQTSTNKEGGRIFASPLAKKIAEDRGIDLADVKGTGENGRIVKKDIESYTPTKEKTQSASASTEKTSAAPAQPFTPAGEVSFEEVKNSQMRKVIAKRLSESKFSAPHYYLTIEVDMENAISSRKIINELPDTKVSFNDMVVKACAMALKRHPQVNTTWKDDVTVYNKHISIGVAVAVPEGLVVPVLPFTDKMNINDIDIKVRDLATRARDKKLAPNEMEGSTFTVSNLGMFGIQEFTSIINQPNSAILSVGAIVEKPVVKNGQIVVGNTMKVTLACDHRTVDGATGAQFLQTLKQYLENPVTMLA